MSQIDVNVIAYIMNIKDILLEDMEFLSDVYGVENLTQLVYQKHDAEYTDLENVSVIIDFVKPVIKCHKLERTGFAKFY